MYDRYSVQKIVFALTMFVNIMITVFLDGYYYNSSSNTLRGAIDDKLKTVALSVKPTLDIYNEAKLRDKTAFLGLCLTTDKQDFWDYSIR